MTSMPGGDLRKNLPFMTRREIASTLVAGTVIGGVIMAVFIRPLMSVTEWTVEMAGWALLWPGAGMLLVVGCLLAAYVQSYRELKRRRDRKSVADCGS
jgi:hypothetical protein